MSSSIVHWREDVSLKARIAGLRLACAIKPRAGRPETLGRARIAFASMVVTAPSRPWLCDSELKARRARSLFTDNPASG